MQDYRDDFFVAHDWVAKLISNISQDQYQLPTPCSEYNVQTMLSHMLEVAETIEKLPVLGHDPLPSIIDTPQKLVQQRKENTRRLAGITPYDIAEQWRERTHRARAHWDDAALEKNLTMCWGETLTGSQAVATCLYESVCHGYDIAVATGQQVEAPGTVGQAALAAAIELVPKYPRGVAEGFPFDPQTIAPENAGPTVKLAAFLGRAV